MTRFAPLALGFVAACAASPMRAEIPTRPERLVLVVGESTDALGIEQTRASDGESVQIALHDGTQTWVEAWRVRDLELVPGSRIVVRWEGRLIVTTLIEHLDRMAWVGIAGGPHLVSLADVLAVVRRTDVIGSNATDVRPTEEVTDVATEPPPPVDPARLVAFDGATMWAVGRLAECEGGTATVLMPEGAPISVPFERVASLTVEAGDHVWAPWQGTIYPAVVLETRAGVVHLQWDDATDAWMPAHELHRVLREPPPASAPRTRPALCARTAPPVLVHLGRVRTAAILESCEEGRASVVRADGTHDQRPLADLSLLGLQPSDAVEARWRDGATYSATVITIDGGTAHVRWSEGSEEDISLAAIVSVIDSARAPRERVAPTCP